MTLLRAAEELAERASRSEKLGRTLTREEVRILDRRLSGGYPGWLARLLTSVPLCGLELGWQEFEPDDDFDGISWLEWCDAAGVLSESVECYPGLGILAAGYVNVASCSAGSGDPYFVCVHDGDDPPLYRVRHDLGDDADLILADGRSLVSPCLSEFFAAVRLD